MPLAWQRVISNVKVCTREESLDLDDGKLLRIWVDTARVDGFRIRKPRRKSSWGRGRYTKTYLSENKQPAHSSKA